MKNHPNEIRSARLRVIFFSIIAIALASCHDDEALPEPPVDLGELWSCYQDSAWDKNSLTNALIGTWQWEFVSCAWFPEQARFVLDSNMTVEFRTDSSLVVKQDNELVQTSKWEVVVLSNDLFSISDDHGVEELYGRILICDDRVVFNASYIDVCDNYFIRVE